MLEKYAFGTYRTTDKSPIHRDALKYALDNKITHIDTSSNYMHGDAERLIGNELKKIEIEKILLLFPKVDIFKVRI